MKIIVAFLLSVIHLSHFGQSATNFHIKLNVSNSDTAKLNAYNAITQFYLYTSGDSANFYNKKSTDLAQKKHLEPYNLRGYLNKAEILRIEKNLMRQT